MTTRRPSKGEHSRAHILDVALKLFRKKGFDATTMRDVAAAADMSLGAAYYHFGSKEAIVLAYYERVARERDRRVRALLSTTSDLRQRILTVYHVHFDIVRRDRQLLGALVRSVADPENPTAVFSPQTRAVREQSISLFREAVSVAIVPEELRDLGALGLWTLDLALMLYFTWDSSPKQQRTRRLIDDAVDMLLPAIPLLSMPVAAPMRDHLKALLERAALLPSSMAVRAG